MTEKDKPQIILMIVFNRLLQVCVIVCFWKGSRSVDKQDCLRTKVLIFQQTSGNLDFAHRYDLQT
jgi:hypothetical protein